MVKQKMRAIIAQERGIEIDYVEVADPDDLSPLATIKDRTVLLVAVRIGATRLIDNLLVV